MTTTSKRILVVISNYPPHVGGMEVVAASQAARLAAAGHTVTVVTSSCVGAQNESRVDGVRVLRIRAWNYLEKWSIPFPIFSPRILPVVFAQAKHADAVHIHDAFYLSSFVAALAAWFYSKPVILVQHVGIVKYPGRVVTFIQRVAYATWGSFALKRSWRVVVYNDIVRDFLTQKLAIPSERIVELRNGIDLLRFHPARDDERNEARRSFGLPLDKPIVLFVGRLVPKKGFLKLLDAADDSYDIVLAGPGQIPQDMARRPGVHFLGSLKYADLAALYRAADIFVFPAESEIFTLAIQEAMATGLPIVTADEPGYREYGLNRKLITLVEPTPQNLRAEITRIIGNTDLRARMSEYSLAYAQSHFNFEANIGELLALYDALPMKRQKIAIVSDAVYPFNKGGKEKRIYEISTRLVRQGYDVTIYCMQWWKGKSTTVIEGVTFEAISPYYGLYSGQRRSIREAVFFSLHCLKLLFREFDSVEIDHMPHLVIFTMKVVCVLKRKRMIVTWHEVWGRNYWKSYLGRAGLFAYWIELITAKLPDTIISVSEHTTRALRDVLGVKNEIVTVPNGLDIVQIGSSQSSHGADILYAGRLIENKHIDVLLRAVALLASQDPNISALIVGEGPERDNLVRLADELGLKGNVSFREFFSDQNDLYRAMHASRVFALPSTREGFGIVVLEANACGLPVVTVSDTGNAAKELIVEGENGFVTQLNATDFAEALRSALSMKQDRAHYRRYVEKYNWDNIIPALLKVYAAV